MTKRNPRSFSPPPNMSSNSNAHHAAQNDDISRVDSPGATSHISDQVIPQSTASTRLRQDMQDMSVFLIRLILDFSKIVLSLILYPTALAFVVYLFISVASSSSSIATSFIVQRVSPLVCAMPLTSTMVICHNLKMEQNSGQVPRFSDLVDLQERFLDLTGSSGYGTSMALDVTTSEIEMRDLTIAVKHSDLPSKAELVPNLDAYVAMAETASFQLSEFDSNLNGVVYSILAIDGYVARKLAEIDQREKERSAVSSIFFSYSSRTAHEEMMKIFNDAVKTLETDLNEIVRPKLSNVVSAHLQQITSSGKTAAVLNELRKRLSTIKATLVLEENGNEAQKEKLKNILSYVGIHSSEVSAINKQQEMLSRVGRSRDAASAQVEATRFQLQQLLSDLRNLRDRVATRRVIGKDSVPIEVHTEVMRKAVKQLTERSEEHGKLREEVNRRIQEGKLLPPS